MTISSFGSPELFNSDGNHDADAGTGEPDFPDQYSPDNPYGFGYTPGIEGNDAAEGRVNSMQPVASEPFSDIVVDASPFGGDVDSSGGSGPWQNV